jgi:hypothetical protein
LNDDHSGKKVRRKRSWYRRRLRIRRSLITAAFVLLLAAVCWQSAARFLALPTLHTSDLLPESFWTRGNVHDNLALMSHARVVHVSPAGQETYPYSIIPGGVHSVAELREVAARDYVVRRHFAGFDFNHARLVRAGHDREVYLSYRIRNHVYWTRKKVRLLAAELLLTDGKITARTRCGNQVSEKPKPEVSDEEPARDILDEPVADIDPFGPSLPFRFSNVRPNLPGGNAIPPSAPQLFAGGFYFPYVEFGVPIPHGFCKPGDTRKKCHHHHKPPTVPEPATLVLFASGLAAIGWRYRRTRRPAQA